MTDKGGRETRVLTPRQGVEASSDLYIKVYEVELTSDMVGTIQGYRGIILLGAQQGLG